MQHVSAFNEKNLQGSQKKQVQRDPFFLPAQSTVKYKHKSNIQNRQEINKIQKDDSDSSETEPTPFDSDLNEPSNQDVDDSDEEMKKRLREVPFEDLALLRKIDAFDNYRNKIKSEFVDEKNERKRRQKEKEKGTKDDGNSRKRSKSAPTEMSAKIPVSRKKIVVPIKKRIARDPRFDTLSGKFNPDLFKKAYSFLDELKEKEIQELKQKIIEEKDPVMKEKLQRGLQILEQRRLQEKRKELHQQIKSQHRKKERELVAKGKNPFFLKRSQVKEYEMVQKYKEMKASGKLDKYLSKKRRRQAKKRTQVYSIQTAKS